MNKAKAEDALICYLRTVQSSQSSVVSIAAIHGPAVGVVLNLLSPVIYALHHPMHGLDARSIKGTHSRRRWLRDSRIFARFIDCQRSHPRWRTDSG